MVSDTNYKKKEGLEIIFYITLGIVMAIIIPLVIGFGLRGFEESFVQGRPLSFGSLLTNYLIYFILILPAFAVIIFPISNLILIKKGEHPATQQNPNFYRIFSVSLIHNPEQGALYTIFRKIGLSRNQNYARWTLSIFRMFAIGTIIFVWLGIASLVFPQAQVIGIPGSVAQQVTPFMEVYFTAEPPAYAETGTMLFVFLLMMGSVSYFTSKFIKDRKLAIFVYFVIGFLIICPVIGLLWSGFHNIVYAGSDQAKFATFVFGWLGSTLTLAFGSYIFWYLWHFWNNIFARLSDVVPSNEDAVFLSILYITIFMVLYFGIEIYAWRRKHKKQNQLETPEPNF